MSEKKNTMSDGIEALSDEFQSTFTRLSDGTLANMFHENERPTVEALVKKHLGVKSVTFTKHPNFLDDAYAMWIIRTT